MFIPINYILFTKSIDMKAVHLTITLFYIVICQMLYSQTNTFPWPTTGSIGIGTTTPAFLLDVDGDIHINDPASGYMIDQEYVLRHNNDPANIYVGVDAGNNTSTGTDNIFVGNNAGRVNTTGDQNTFVGQAAGQNNTTGVNGVFIGEASGLDNTTGFQNVFIGMLAGDNNTTGDNNTCIGQSTVLGGGNLFNATAIGAFATVTQDNSLVLGAMDGQNGVTGFNTNVGIGTPAPLSVLHLNRSTNTAVVTRYTNNNTGNTAFDGFLAGINAAGEGILSHLGFFPIEVTTPGLRATFTSMDASLVHTLGTSGTPGTDGEGLRIWDPNANTGGLGHFPRGWCCHQPQPSRNT